MLGVLIKKELFVELRNKEVVFFNVGVWEPQYYSFFHFLSVAIPR